MLGILGNTGIPDDFWLCGCCDSVRNFFKGGMSDHCGCE